MSAKATRIATELQPDPALVQDAGYRLDATDRQYIDTQIRATQQHVADSLINGVVATWRTVHASSAALVAGDVVCITTGGMLTLAVPGALSSAGTAFGVCLTAAAPGTAVRIAVGGVLGPEITGLGATQGLVRVSTLGRCERVTTLAPTDYQVGVVTSAGYLTLTKERALESAAASSTTKTPVRAVAASNISNLASASVTQDGVTLAQNDRVLLSAQTTAAQNGIYNVGVVGGGLAPLTRDTDADSALELPYGTTVTAKEGTSFAGSTWSLASTVVTIDVTAQDWRKVGPQYYAVGPLSRDVSIVGSTPTTIIVSRAIALGTSPVTVPATAKLQFVDGGSVSVATGQTLTINGTILAGLQQIFSFADATSVLALGRTATRKLPVEWFGAIGDGSSANATANTAALNRIFSIFTQVDQQIEAVFGAGKSYYTNDTVIVCKPGTAVTSYIIRGNGAYIAVDGEAIGARPAFELGRSIEYETTTTGIQTLPTGTINVADTANFAASGSLRVVTTNGEQLVTYTGKGGTTFTGCTGGTGNTSAGGKVYGNLQINSAASSKLHRLEWHGLIVQRSVFETTTTGVQTLPVGTINVASTSGFPSSGTLHITTTTGVSTVTYTGKGGTTFTGCTGGTGDTSNGGKVVNASASYGLQVNACDHAVFDHSSFDRFYSGVRWAQEGGNGCTFYDCSISAAIVGARLGGLGTNSSIADAYNGNNISWIGGKIQACTQIGMHASGVGFVIEDVDFSVCAGMAFHGETLGQARLKFYTESIGTNKVGQTQAVCLLTDCRSVEIVGSWLNATGDADSHDVGYGLRLTGCDHVDIRANTFNRARLADIRVDADCGRGIVIHESAYAEPINGTHTSKKLRVADFRTRRIRNDVRTQDLPSSSYDPLYGEPVNIIASPNKFDHPTWLPTNVTFGATVLGPDGLTQADTINFNDDFSAATLALTAQPEMGVGDLDGYEIVLRYWWRPISVLVSSTSDKQVLRTEIRREVGDQNFYDSTGACDAGGAAGDWQFEEHVYAVPNGTSTKLYTVLFTCPYDGISIALWGVQLFARLPANARAHVPAMGTGRATALLAGPVASPDKTALDAAVAAWPRFRRLNVTHVDVDGVGATSTSINLGAPLPANAYPIGAAISLITPFTGGGATTVTADIGTTGDDDAIVDGANVFAAAVDGQASTLPAGIAPHKPLGAAQLKLRLASDVNLSALTAGELLAEVAYVTQGGSNLWEPVEADGCTLWLPATSGSKTLVGTRCSQWSDASVKAFHATQSTDADRPAYCASDPSVNGLPTLAFDGSTELMVLTTGQTVGSLIAAAGFSVYALLVIEDSHVNLSHELNDAIISDSVGFWDISTTSDGRVGPGTYDGAHDSKYTAVQWGRRVIVAARHDGTNLHVQVNNGAETTQAQGNTTGAGNSVTWLGRGSTGGRFQRMRIAELFVFDRKTSSGEHAAAMSRLNALGAVY